MLADHDLLLRVQFDVYCPSYFLLGDQSHSTSTSSCTACKDVSRHTSCLHCPLTLQAEGEGDFLDGELPQALQPGGGGGGAAPLLWWRMDHQGSPGHKTSPQESNIAF